MTDYQTQMDFLVKKWGPAPKPAFDVDAFMNYIRTAPIYDPDPKRSENKTRRMAHEDGRAARAIGLPADHASGLFFDETLRVCWQIGWRHKDEELKGWRDPKTGLITALGMKNGL